MKTSKIFYGWWIVAVCFIAQFLAVGIAVHSFGVFFKPLAKEFGWSRTAISLGHSAFTIMIALSGPIVGRCVDSYGAKRVMLFGSIVMGLSLISLSRLNSLWHFYLSYLFLGLGENCLALIAPTWAISHWFTKRRGLAIGIIFVGIGLGGMTMASFSYFLISYLSWRIAYLSLGLLFFIIALPSVWIWIRDKPEQMGLWSDGEKPVVDVSKPISTTNPEGFSATMALRTASFWILALVFCFTGIVMGSSVVHIVPSVTDAGFSPTFAAASYSFVMGISTFGRIIYGYLTDKIDKRYPAMLCYLLLGMGVLLLLILASSNFLVYLFILVMGLGIGGPVTLQAILIGYCFGLKAFGIIYGYLRIAWGVGTALGPVFAGYVFDTAQSYAWAFITAVALSFLASVLIFFAKAYEPLSIDN